MYNTYIYHLQRDTNKQDNTFILLDLKIVETNIQLLANNFFKTIHLNNKYEIIQFISSVRTFKCK